MGFQHAEKAVAVRARWWHQGRNAINQLQWREGNLIHLGAELVMTRLAVLFGAEVDQLAARFAQPLHRKRGARAVPQQALQARTVVRRYAHARVYREAAVPVRQHLFGLETLEQTAPHKGAQDAFAQAGLRLGHCFSSDAGGRVEDDTRLAGLRTGLSVSITLARHFLKHAIDCADM